MLQKQKCISWVAVVAFLLCSYNTPTSTTTAFAPPSNNYYPKPKKNKQQQQQQQAHYALRQNHFLVPKYTNVGLQKGGGTDEFIAADSSSSSFEKQQPSSNATNTKTTTTTSTSTSRKDLSVILHVEGEEQDQDESTLSSSSSSSSSSSTALAPVRPRRMNLMFCDRDKCRDVVRERVVGEHNQIILNGPATGQVAYRWSSSITTQNKNGESSSSSLASPTVKRPPPMAVSSVLLLVRPNNEELLELASDAVRRLTSQGIQVLLSPDVAGKLKFHFHVDDDDDMIQLFEEPNQNKKDKSKKKQKRYVDDDESNWSEEVKVDPFPDLICTLGGDGLLMYAGMLFQGPIPPVLSIAGGSLGFLTAFSVDELVESVEIALGMVTKALGETEGKDDIVEDDVDDLQVFPPNMNSYPYEPLPKTFQPPYMMMDAAHKFNFGMGGVICMTIRMRLDCRIVSPEGLVKDRYNVLNEVVVDRGSSPYLAALECFCDDVHLTTVQADGIIFATPTGSTAYSMAAGGSVVHPAVPCILVTPICPHVLSFRSMVFPDHVILRCYVPEDARATASVAFDGKHRQELQRGDSVQIQMSSYPVPTINRGDHSSDWLESLKRSFHFNTRPRQRPL